MRTLAARFGLFVSSLTALTAVAAPPTTQPIDRHALVSRHDVVVNAPEPVGALSVGNGSFAFNFDVTGLQTFPEYYAKTTPLGVLSDWGWHATPNPQGFSLATFPFKTIPKNGRTFSYPAAGTAHPTTQAAYLRSSPQRIGLGMIGLVLTKADGSAVAITDLQQVQQHLDLWDGRCDSAFAVDGQTVKVTTVASADKDQVGVRIESPLIAAGRLKVRIAFPYASESFGPDYNDWSHPDAHATAMTPRSHGVDFARTLDDTRYAVRLRWEDDAATLQQTAKHEFVLAAPGNTLSFTVRFSPAAVDAENDTVADVQAAAATAWQAFWTKGGAIDFSGTADPRAAELERRLVLSEYVMAVHDAGHSPPQETGLAANSWYGKFHMEMYWWHAAALGRLGSSGAAGAQPRFAERDDAAEREDRPDGRVFRREMAENDGPQRHREPVGRRPRARLAAAAPDLLGRARLAGPARPGPRWTGTRRSSSPPPTTWPTSSTSIKPAASTSSAPA